MKIRDRIIELKRVKAKELSPHPSNWRTHPQKQQDAMRGALAEIGYADALKVRQHNGGYQIIDGHLRAETTPEMEVPVLVLDLDESETKKMLATFDPLAGLAEADEDMLKGLAADIEFDSSDLGDLVKGLLPDDTPEIVEDDVPGVPTEAVTRTGDVWKCGDHRVVCGDAGKVKHDDTKCGLCFTSPPYAQQREYTKAVDVSDWDGLMQSVFGNLPMADDGQVLVNLGLIHRDGEWMPYWDSWIEWMRSQGWRRFGWYVWDQGFGLPGDWSGRFAPSHEWVFHFNKGSKRPAKWTDKQPENIKPRNKGESTMRKADGSTAPFTNPAASGQKTKIPDSVVRVGRQVGSNGHPAQFPVAFPAAFVLSWPGSVCDPFLGSGTTLIAAEQLGRRCYGIEIEPKYVDVTLRRWMNLTNDSPVRESDGAKFSDLQTSERLIGN